VDSTFSQEVKNKIYNAITYLGNTFVQYGVDSSPDAAFMAVYGSLSFENVSDTKKSIWGETVGSTIYIYRPDQVGSSYFNNFLVHELGHAFDNTLYYYNETNEQYETDCMTMKWQSRVAFSPNMPKMPRGNKGYKTSSYPSLWIQGIHPDENATDPESLNEEVADMFLGWAYSAWPDSPTGRRDWMNLHMPEFLSGGCTVP
jgi:hypothetical protein